jgi:hypothetical protein
VGELAVGLGKLIEKTVRLIQPRPRPAMELLARVLTFLMVTCRSQARKDPSRWRSKRGISRAMTTNTS